ncbi:MAG TPA: DNA polymerase III subunit beta [bacterium]|nr:DNA polymerase III subunit beta [bacterium]
MKIEVLREKLNQAVSIVSRAAIKSASLPILEGVMVKADDNTVQFSATDLEVGIRVSALAKISKSGQAVVPARILSALGKLMSGDKVSLELIKNSLVIKDDDNETSLQTLVSEDFPVIPQPNDDFSVEINGSELSKGLAQVIDCVSTSQSRPEISGVYLKISGDQLTIAATDSYRLAQKNISLSVKAKKDREMILPAKAVNHLIGIIGETNNLIKVSGDDNQIRFEFTLGEAPLSLEIEMVSRLIEGTYPRYQEVIPQKSSVKIRVDRHEFMGKIKAASLLSDQTYEVRLSTQSEEGRLKIEARSSRVGEFKSSLVAEIEGGETEVSFNGRFLSDALLNLSGSDAQIGLTDSDKAALIKSGDDQSYLYVLMPIRSN